MEKQDRSTKPEEKRELRARHVKGNFSRIGLGKSNSLCSLSFTLFLRLYSLSYADTEV